MTTTFNHPVTVWRELPAILRQDGAINLELEEGVLILRAGPLLRNRIEELLDLQDAYGLTPAQTEELWQYEKLDDYLSLLNRLARNLYHPPAKE